MQLRKKFNFEPLGPIDSDIPVVCELELFVTTTTIVLLAGNKNPINAVFNQILNIFAMKAYDANLTAGELKISDYAILMVDKYRDIVDNLPKEEAYKELFFNKWPNKCIPQAYTSWVEEVFKKGPHNTELNKWIDKHAQKYAHATKEVKLKVAFGGKLINEAQAARGQIRSHHNRLYQPPHELASGKSMTAMFKAMKKQLLKMAWQEQGHNTLSKKADWKNSWSYEEKARQLEDYRDKKYAEWEEKGDAAHLPDYWLTFQLCSLPVQFHYPGKKMTLDCLVPPEEAAAAPMEVPLEPKTFRRAARNAAGKTKGTASGAAGIPVEDLTGEEESNTFTFIHKRERKEGPHVEAVAALTSELENLKNSVGLLASIPGPASGDAIAHLTDIMVQIIIQLSALQREQSEFFIQKKPKKLSTPAQSTPSVAVPNSGLLSTYSDFDPHATANMPDDYTGYDDGSAFFAGQRNYVVAAANDAEETDEEAEMEKVRATLGQRD